MSSNVLLMNKARASHARGDFAAAASAYETILKLDPRNYEAAYPLAVASIRPAGWSGRRQVLPRPRG